MAQASKESILLGMRTVGTVSVDGGAVRGEGGPSRPQLVVPLTIQMEPQPEGSTLAVCWVRASLSTEQNAASQRNAVGTPASELLVHEFPVRSFPSGTADHNVDLRFHLTPGEVGYLERRRHTASTDVLVLHLSFDVVVAGLKTHNQVIPNREHEATPWDINCGMFSEVLPFWSSKIRPTRVQIEHSTWVRNVLPGLGYDRVRLVEMVFPPPLPDHRSAASEWDKARRALDDQRYSDCVSECRDILAMWQTQIGATKDRPLADVISEKRGWAEGDGRTAFLDGLWKAAIDIVNAPHHPEGRPAEQNFDASDARLMLLLTASLSEYVNSNQH